MKTKHSTGKSWAILGGIFLIIVLLLILTQISWSTQPLYAARQEAYAMAKDQGLIQPEKFYYYNSDGTYYSVVGKDSKGQDQVLIFWPSGELFGTYKTQDIFPEDQAILQAQDHVQGDIKILESRIGVDEGQAVWEISFENTDGSMGYYYTTLLDGVWVKTIDRI